MPRLRVGPGASLVLSLVAACEGGGGGAGPSPPPPGRVVAVAAHATGQADLADLCEVRPAGAGSQVFSLPPLAAGAPAGDGAGARWVNVWATWCRPCVQELPLLVEWQRRLAADGREVSLVFVSADESDEAIEAFRQSHPGLPESARLADPGAVRALAERAGLAGGATLPLHFFVGADQRLRCARGGAVGQGDYEAVRAVFAP